MGMAVSPGDGAWSGARLSHRPSGNVNRLQSAFRGTFGTASSGSLSSPNAPSGTAG